MYKIDYKFGYDNSSGSMVIPARDEEDAWAEAYCILTFDNGYNNVIIKSIVKI